jgi:hypothetical protein
VEDSNIYVLSARSYREKKKGRVQLKDKNSISKGKIGGLRGLCSSRAALWSNNQNSGNKVIPEALIPKHQKLCI